MPSYSGTVCCQIILRFTYLNHHIHSQSRFPRIRTISLQRCARQPSQPRIFCWDKRLDRHRSYCVYHCNSRRARVFIFHHRKDSHRLIYPFSFLQILPIYVDHILYPTITDDGFVTEVHHINEKAEDAGVVYAEVRLERTLAKLYIELYSGVDARKRTNIWRCDGSQDAEIISSTIQCLQE